MKKIKNALSSRIVRFVIVGTANAAISFGILNLAFYKFGQTKIISSIIATTCALAFSFLLNRNYVFADKSKRLHKQAIPFVIVTVSGSLILLNIVYVLSLKLLNGHETFLIDIIKTLTSLRFTRNFIDINLSTAIGAVTAMIWNYNGYRYFVFNGVQTPDEVKADEADAA